MCKNSIEVKSNYIKRNSSIELLRIISIFGIITMHCFGEYYLTCTGIDLVFGILINTLFNSGVSCFMLISGFYGLQFKIDKLIKIVLIVLFYSHSNLIALFALTKSIPKISIVLKSFFPLLTGKYWYMSCYVIIYLLSNYINKFIEQLPKIRFIKLICILLIFFYISPTILYFQLLNDSGKGIVNLFILYLTGRFINKYYNSTVKNTTIIIMYFANIIAMFTFTFLVSSYPGSGGIKYPIMIRDNSLFIYVNSILLFLLFYRLKLYNTTINFIASCVMGIYLNEGIVRYIVSNTNLKLIFIDNALIIRVILTSIFVFIISFMYEIFRCFLFNILKSDIIISIVVFFLVPLKKISITILAKIVDICCKKKKN